MRASDFFDRTIEDVSLKCEKTEIGETTESRTKGLESLRKKLLKVKDLNSRLDDEFLLRFLRIAKFDVKKACERVRKYYSVRRTYSHALSDFYPTATNTALRMGHLLVCPRRAEDHCIILIHKRGMFDPTKMIYEEVFLMDCLVLDFLSQNPFSQLCGIHVILDVAGYGFQHFVQDTPRRLKMAIDTMQNSFPLRYKSIHIINAPRLFSFVYNLCYPFLTTKIQKRLFLHNDSEWKSLHSVLPPDVLPLEYGGTLPKTDLIDLTDEIVNYDAHFKEQLQYGFVKKT